MGMCPTMSPAIDVHTVHCHQTKGIVVIGHMQLPSVPAPNKWTTMFGCIDFVLSGIVIHRWLPEVFRRAFRDMTFAEFDELSSSTDCRLLE